MSLFAGVDLGTSGVKCLLFDPETNQSWTGKVDYHFDIPQLGWAEQDPDVWWQATKQAMKLAAEEASLSLDYVQGISFSGQMHGLVMVDDCYESIRPSIIWCDQRTADIVNRINTPEVKNLFKKYTCNQLNTGFALASLLWVREHEPEHFKKIYKIACPKDYIRYKLCGRWSSEQTDASSTSAFDVHQAKWSQDILDHFQLPIEIFPEVQLPMDLAGLVSDDAAAELGLSKSCKIFCGASDQVMQAVGNGILSPGPVSVTIGTGGQVLTVLNKSVAHPTLSAHTFNFVFPESWYFLGATLSAGLSLRWLKNHVIQAKSYAEMSEWAENVQCGSEGLVFLPYLLGDRSPHMDPNASGMFFGLKMKHQKEHFVRSVMEGVAFSLKDCVNLLNDLDADPTSLIASGGGANSRVWLQILADVMDLPLRVSGVKEQAAMGAAMIAAVGCGAFTSLQDAAKRFIQYPGEPILPNSSNVAIYHELYTCYRDLYKVNHTLMQEYYSV